MTTNRIHHSARLIALLCMIFVILASCSRAPATVAPTTGPEQTPTTGQYWPTGGWRTSSPEEQGMDSRKLAQMLDAISQQNLNLHSLLVVRNGYLVSETYFRAYQQDTKHEIYSITKSFVSTLIGIALDKGFIDTTDHRILDYFPQRTFENTDKYKEAITLDNLLTMRSGLDWQEGDPAYMALIQSPDWVKFMLDKPLDQPPGTWFNYCSGCSHLLSAILEETTGMNTFDFAKQNLFQPLGITDVTWDSDSQGIPIGGWGLQLTPRDMAKLGYLYLYNGVWDGDQIVSGDWVNRATQTHTETDSDFGYGYQWWTYPSLSAYMALGRYGQTIFVVPRSNLVVVATAELDSHVSIFRLIQDYILPAVQPSE
jgi:CubicO group peptidase (beta-lactamase class C family)